MVGLDKFFRISKRRFKRMIQHAIYSVVRIDRAKVVFDNFDGRDVGCNPGYIAKYMSKHFPQLKLVWLLAPKFSGNHHSWVSYASSTFIGKTIAMASAKVVVYNTVNAMSGWPKKKGQTWVQTGHGSFGIKKIGLDVGETRRRKIEREQKKTNYFLSNSSFESRVFSSGFLYPKYKIFEFGHARSDVFFNEELMAQGIANVRQKLGLGSHKLLMFAPSFSDADISLIQQFDVPRIKEALAMRFGGDWVVGVRPHPRTLNKLSRLGSSATNCLGADIVDLSDFSDMQELLMVSDVVVTDISSCIFDFLLLARPCFFYLSKEMEDENQDQVYFPFRDTPIAVSNDIDILIQNIASFNSESFYEEVGVFLKNAGSFEDGQASKRAAELIFSATNGANSSTIRYQFQSRTHIDTGSLSVDCRGTECAQERLEDEKSMSIAPSFEENERFGLLSYSSMNIGDEIQSIAASRFLPRVDCFVHREQVNTFQSKVKTKLIMNAWWMWRPKNFPPSEDISPLMISMYFRDEIRDQLCEHSLGYLKGNGPIGCRDVSSRDYLVSKGIDAYFSGCLTLTLKRNPAVERGDFIIAVDLPKKALQRLRQSTNRRVFVLTPIMTPSYTQKQRNELAQVFIYLLSRAHCVVTTRLHTALPCLALETPVLRIDVSKDENNIASRFSGYEDCLHTSHEKSGEHLFDDFDVNDPPKNPDKYMEIRNNLIKEVSGFTGFDSEGASYDFVDDIDALMSLTKNQKYDRRLIKKTLWWGRNNDLIKIWFSKYVLKKTKHDR